jgi:hypothetical protein
MGRGRRWPDVEERKERTGGTERSGEPSQPMSSLKPVGLFHLPLEPLTLRRAQDRSGMAIYTRPVSVGGTRKPRFAPHLRKECTMIPPTNQVTRFLAMAHRPLAVVWHVLTEATADRDADQEMVAFKLMPSG